MTVGFCLFAVMVLIIEVLFFWAEQLNFMDDAYEGIS